MSADRMRWVYAILNEPMKVRGVGRFLGVALLVLIALNALLVFVEIESGVPAGLRSAMIAVDTASTFVFAFEYVLRIVTAIQQFPGRPAAIARIRYVFSPLGLVDLASFLPQVLTIFGIIPLNVLNSLRILRVLRLMKVSHYIPGFGIIGRALAHKSHEILASFAVILLLVLASSVLMFQIEHQAQPEVFDSIFSGLYWAVVTISGTGYGDMVPITAAGRAVGFVVLLFSIAVVAVPAGIVTAGFIDEAQAERERKSKAAAKEVKTGATRGAVGSHGGTAGDCAHATGMDFSYCPYCGRRLPGEDELRSAEKQRIGSDVDPLA